MRADFGIFIVMSLLGYAAGAAAHELRLNARVDGSTLYGRVHYTPDTPAVGCEITIRPEGREPIARLIADSQGRFSYPISFRARYIVRARTADLHEASQSIEADQFPANLPDISNAPPTHQLYDQAVQEQLNRKISTDLREIREQMDRLEQTLGIRDIVGGVGFVVGVLGLLYFLKRRRSP